MSTGQSGIFIVIKALIWYWTSMAAGQAVIFGVLTGCGWVLSQFGIWSSSYLYCHTSSSLVLSQ